MKKTEKRWLWISLGFSLVVLAIILFFTVDSSTFTLLERMNPSFLLLALLIHLLALFFWSLRIWFMSRGLGYTVPLAHCINLVYANLLVAAITPSQAGGEPVRIHELYKAGVKVGDATAIVITERILDGIVLGLGGAFFMFVLGSIWQTIGSVYSYFLYVSWIFITGLVLVFLYSVKNPQILKNFLGGTVRHIARFRGRDRADYYAQRIDREVDNFHATLALFLRQGKTGLLLGLVCTTAFWFLEAIIVSVILVGLSQPPILVESMIIQLVIAIIMMIPLTPGGSGIAEVLFSTMYGIYIPHALIGIVVVLWRSILYYSNILLGFLGSLVIVRREAQSRDGDKP
ncbi:MAG: flippase-like domain-containing protein [Methanolinea sp.]|nr:flippase-like domain-containing protein [Methanolinea sp.]